MGCHVNFEMVENQLKPLIKFCNIFLSDVFEQALPVNPVSTIQNPFAKGCNIPLNTGEFFGWDFHVMGFNYSVFKINFGNGTSLTMIITPMGVIFRDKDKNNHRHDDFNYPKFKNGIREGPAPFVEDRDALENVPNRSILIYIKRILGDLEIDEEKWTILPFPDPPTPQKLRILLASSNAEAKDRAYAWRNSLYKNRGTDAETLAILLARNGGLLTNFVDLSS